MSALIRTKTFDVGHDIMKEFSMTNTMSQYQEFSMTILVTIPRIFHDHSLNPQRIFHDQYHVANMVLWIQIGTQTLSCVSQHTHSANWREEEEEGGGGE
jgi:hypothetical protein